MDKKVTCSKCNGKGKVSDLQMFVVLSIPMNKTCDKCKGRGYVISK